MSREAEERSGPTIEDTIESGRNITPKVFTEAKLDASMSLLLI